MGVLEWSGSREQGAGARAGAGAGAGASECVLGAGPTGKSNGVGTGGKYTTQLYQQLENSRGH